MPLQNGAHGRAIACPTAIARSVASRERRAVALGIRTFWCPVHRYTACQGQRASCRASGWQRFGRTPPAKRPHRPHAKSSGSPHANALTHRAQSDLPPVTESRSVVARRSLVSQANELPLLSGTNLRFDAFVVFASLKSALGPSSEIVEVRLVPVPLSVRFEDDSGDAAGVIPRSKHASGARLSVTDRAPEPRLEWRRDGCAT